MNGERPTSVLDKVTQPPPAYSGFDLTISNKTSTGTASVVVHEGKSFELVGSAISAWMKRRYTEAAALAKVKIVAVGGMFALLAGGLTVKIVGTGVGLTLKAAEFITASPGLSELLCGLGALVFVVSMDVYGMWRRSADERYFWKLASDPNLPPETRTALLERLRK